MAYEGNGAGHRGGNGRGGDRGRGGQGGSRDGRGYGTGRGNGGSRDGRGRSEGGYQGRDRNGRSGGYQGKRDGGFLRGGYRGRDERDGRGSRDDRRQGGYRGHDDRGPRGDDRPGRSPRGDDRPGRGPKRFDSRDDRRGNGGFDKRGYRGHDDRGPRREHGDGPRPAEIRMKQKAKRDEREARSREKRENATFDAQNSTYNWQKFSASEQDGAAAAAPGANSDAPSGRRSDDRGPRSDGDRRGGSDDRRGPRDDRGSRRDGRDFGRDDRGPRSDDRKGPRRDGDRGPARGGDRKGRGPAGGRGQGRGGRRNPVLSPARKAACAIGRVVRERNAYVAEVTPAVLSRFEGMSASDAAFATKLARGVTATVGTLDEFIDRNMKSPTDIDADVRDAMRVSAYELLFLDKASYAVVDQGVELVVSVAPHAGGLANAVLRRMCESAKAFPFGNPSLSLQVLARSQAFPLWLAKRLMNEMGLAKATEFMRASNADAPVFIAVNPIKGDAEHIEEVFDMAGTLLEKSGDVPGCYRVVDARALRKPEVRELFEGGQVCVSDESAQAVAALAMPEAEPKAYLEIGSGRGTKTILLQAAAHRSFGHGVPMTSVDDHAFKSELLAKRCEAYGIDCVTPLTADARGISQALAPESFDAVLIDAPCSGVGTLRRHPEIRWRLREADIERMAAVNLDLLSEAAKMVAAGGCLVYATCTVFPEENEQVVERFLESDAGKGFSVERTLTTVLSPTGPDAHYAVRLRRA